MSNRTGFTLVEILIVVIILGILAAIVIPQFTEASQDARESALVSDLQTFRSQIELYKIQHKDALPGAGTASFVAAMTGQTDIDGAVGTDYGPYLQKMPTNPFNNLDTVTVEAGVGSLGDDSTGWHFNTSNGQVHANDDDSTSDGTAHTAL
ncbi:MAG: prepilin-type N-terminal cleavage/methylation domain-containing protein [Planctomycetota bacterium]|nr:prepilin-type N-terminal cleavage/methylation domain-containing protein [Planctomycetota bacterium]